MIAETVSNERDHFSSSQSKSGGRDIHQAQQAIYQFLLDSVKICDPEDVLEEFKRLFIDHVETVSSTTVGSVYELLFANNQVEFLNTLKRSCYILINNWETRRAHYAIQKLVALFEDPVLQKRTVSPTLRRLRSWLNIFVESQDYTDLKLFAARYDTTETKHWSDRYTPYLLISQFVDPNNSLEQREAARVMAQRLKDKFKFDLAMYTAKSQVSILHADEMPNNPTGLGKETLRLIKMIVMRRGAFSYANLARIFEKQTADIRYQSFKRSLLKYLIFALPQEDLALTIQNVLSQRLETLYSSHHDEVINDALLLRTCNRIIEYLTTEDRNSPSYLFGILLSNNNPLPLVSLLLKLILICRNSRTHLEARIADLVRYYQNSPEDECQWVVNFFEVFNITFTIYTENVEYNIVHADTEKSTLKLSQPEADPQMRDTMPQFLSTGEAAPWPNEQADPWEKYRVFSQLRQQEVNPELTPEMSLDSFETQDLPDHLNRSGKWSDSDKPD